MDPALRAAAPFAALALATCGLEAGSPGATPDPSATPRPPVPSSSMTAAPKAHGAAVPPLDRRVPDHVETATFALG